jgi:hypothetical protein
MLVAFRHVLPAFDATSLWGPSRSAYHLPSRALGPVRGGCPALAPAIGCFQLEIL